ncbi:MULTISPECIES: 8-amino-7-oxononanoate synthase [unclassified Shewanella]|uniref:aminotransferase class I/II-fold pyridoxal phosphate-dependent enzyme n=1 Tax=unclassified Shewanella TaxID=196818 RepID=UPI000C85D3D2|nr:MULTISPECIES: 8-amino-7-oxononanoate synthase [unclassified Shewanella]MDO6774302.1 8-amino-7-oxononanoate synthase [Shewanella sp. 3_MG-2023]PMG42243.1 8-amino-7-oxononanoate synthase [Shewanella sp. 10N.286.52.B9]
MANHPISSRISHRLQQLQTDGLLRQRKLAELDKASANNLAPTIPNIIDFSHNDYLGLANDPEMIAAIHAGAIKYGVGSKASPLVSGYSEAHLKLEQGLCELTGHEAGLLFCSGFSANQALIKTLFEAGDVIIADKLIHASVIDGVKDSGAALKRYKHNDITHAEQLLNRFPNSALFTESVFSMDGDRAPLDALSNLCKQHNSWLVVDDAHGFGINYEELASNRFNVSRAAVTPQCDIQVITFGKALGCQGACVLASQQIIDYMVAQSRHYIYSTALSPASAHLALTAVNLTQSQPDKASTLFANIAFFRSLCNAKNIALTESTTAIQPVIIGDSERTLAIAKALKQQGLQVGAIRPPTVPKGQARLRVTINASHNAEQITQLVDALAVQLPREY